MWLALLACLLTGCGLVLDVDPGPRDAGIDARERPNDATPVDVAFDGPAADGPALPDADARAMIDADGAFIDVDLPDAALDVDVPPDADVTIDADPPDACVIACASDGDGDFWGSGDVIQVPCGVDCPPGTTSMLGDCQDGVFLAHPEEPNWFPFAYDDVTGSPSFDYDCSGVEEQRLTYFFTGCMTSMERGCFGDGWAGSEVPDCGELAPATVCSGDSSICSPQMTERQQTCH